MSSKAYYLIAFFVIISPWCNANQETINKNLVNTLVERKIDVSTQLVKVKTTITLENTGHSSTRSFLFAIDPVLQSHLSFIGAADTNDEDRKLAVSKANVVNNKDKEFWLVDLGAMLEAGKSVTVEVETTFTHALTPHPSQITQTEKQLVVFEANLYFYSPYSTTSQTTVVTTVSSNIESYTKTKPVSQSDNTVTYGPHEDKDQFSEGDLRVHYENNSPFLTITNMERIIEISHWGNIAIEEHVQIRHSGALLKGSFSRYDYQLTGVGMGVGASVKSFKSILPASAQDVYYRDEIGNISTSHLSAMEDSVELELDPRFPLFGGWKTQYYIGYNVPSYEYLYNKGDDYALKVRFLDHVYDDQIIDSLTVKVILPEGAKDIAVETPYDVKRSKDELQFTYLDTTGRPVIIMHRDNLIDKHIQDFQLSYSFKKYLLIIEPLLVVGAFYLFFLVVIIYVRLDFSITKDEAKESRMRLTALIEEVQSTQDKRSALYQSFDDAINKFKANKDVNAFTQGRKKIDADYKQLTQRIHGLQTQLKVEGADLAEKVGELQKLDSQYKEQIGLAVNYAERLIANKLNKQQYIDLDTQSSSKREDIYQKMENLRSTL